MGVMLLDFIAVLVLMKLQCCQQTAETYICHSSTTVLLHDVG